MKREQKQLRIGDRVRVCDPGLLATGTVTGVRHKQWQPVTMVSVDLGPDRRPVELPSNCITLLQD